MASIVILGSGFLAYQARKSYKAHKAEKAEKKAQMSIADSSTYAPSDSHITTRATDSPAYDAGTYDESAYGKLPGYDEATQQTSTSTEEHRTNVSDTKVAL